MSDLKDISQTILIIFYNQCYFQASLHVDESNAKNIGPSYFDK
ncbi:hypothetical protein J2S21_003512 [Peribacillus cavernae]|nr:hypothetical protein [Peribacillus cavernae]